MSIEAVIYRRVSSHRQAEAGKSLRDQDAGLIAHCRANGWRIIGNFEDAVSGRTEKTEKRVGFAAAVELACERKATLVVFDVDRLGRSQSVGMRVVERLRAAGAKLSIKSLGVDTNTPAGEMILGIMLAVAQWGSRAIGAGVKRAHEATMAELGYRTQGAQRFGWEFDHATGRVVENAEEQAVIRDVLALAAENHRTHAEMAAVLNERGIKTPSELEWNARNLGAFVRKHGNGSRD